MQHLMLDGYKGFRSRFDDLRLIYELMQELPARLGLRPVMPPFLLPYYDGVEADDVGISAYIFLAGGHLTVHTFSYRECYFADLVAPDVFDGRQFRFVLDGAFPCEVINQYRVERGARLAEAALAPEVQPAVDFGPHYLLDLEGYAGPRDLDALFTLFDRLPGEVGMTPIMRPSVMRTQTPRGEVISAMTMIAESHIALHIFPESNTAHFDLFSCKFFNEDEVLPQFRARLPAAVQRERLTARGSKYLSLRTERPNEVARARRWLGLDGEVD